MTNADKFKEVFGFYFNRYGVGCVIDDCPGGGCRDCQYGTDWWDAPYEASKGDNNG